MHAPREARQRRQEQRDRHQREEVEPPDPGTRRVVHVDKVVDSVDRVLESGEHEYRGSPAPPPHRHQEDDAERDVEGCDVLDIVVILGRELAERVVERAGGKEHERPQQQVVHGQNQQDGPQPLLRHRATTLTSLPGTTIVLTIAWPFSCAFTFGESCASRSSSSRGVSGATDSRSRTLPFTWITISIASPTASAGFAVGHGSSQTRLPVSRSKTSHARCGAAGKMSDAAVATPKPRFGSSRCA